MVIATDTRAVVPAQGSLDGEPFVPAQDINEYHEPVLHISLGGRQHRATAEQITACPLESFAALWTVRRILNMSTHEHYSSMRAL